MTVRFIFQVLRAFPPQQVYAQTVLGFELASADPRVVGINFVQPEDSYMSMSEYDRQMKFLQFLKTKYPKVHLSLHAGELAPGIVPPDGLKFHIREAVEVAGAERIGHGVDVMYETDPHALLKEMAAKHVMVEINLTSNDGILGITGNHHPLANYRAAKVPVSLSTDDEGVSRSDLTTEYTRAATEQNLTYMDLKNMARTGIEHTFLPGDDLWSAPDAWSKPVAVCAAQPLGADKPTARCAEFLKSSEKATQQWELERRFRTFEAGVQ
jgi:adenosine deaminase